MSTEMSGGGGAEHHRSLDYACGVTLEGLRRITGIVTRRELEFWNKQDGTILTNGDVAVDEYFHEQYAGTGVVLCSEEREAPDESDASQPIIDLDPNDGTAGLVMAYLAWLSIPEGRRPPLPTSGAMISAALRVGPARPWGIVGAGFLPTGPRLYTAVEGNGAKHIDINSGVSRELIVPAIDADAVKVVLVSERTAARYGKSLERAGLTVLESGVGGVASAMSVFDHGLFEELRPGMLPKNGRVVANVMSGGYDWDVAAVLVIAKALGLPGKSISGGERVLGMSLRGARFAASAAIDQMLHDGLK